MSNQSCEPLPPTVKKVLIGGAFAVASWYLFKPLLIPGVGYGLYRLAVKYRCL